MFTLRYDGSGNHIKFGRAVELLGTERRAHSAFRRAINRTGDQARTHTIRALARQVGLSQVKVRRLGQIGTDRASFSRLEYKITSRGSEIPLKEFSASQFSYGVRAKPWGQSRRFPGTFIFAGTPRSGKFVAGGHVFRRTSSASFPIQRLYGPSVPKEIVQGASADAFQDAALNLGPRIAHEVRVMTKGVVS